MGRGEEGEGRGGREGEGRDPRKNPGYGPGLKVRTYHLLCLLWVYLSSDDLT